MTMHPDILESDFGVAIGVYGKHPAFGDFVSTGFSQPLVSLLEQWFAHVMPLLKSGWGDAWEHNFDNAHRLRFWFGPDLTPEGRGFLGIVQTSRDKVGRRFPLIAGFEGSALASPVQDQNQDTFLSLENALDRYERADGSDAKAFGLHMAQALTGFDATLQPQPATTGFWAARNDDDIARLWQDAAVADHEHAMRGRSYVWRSDKESSAVYVGQGWPDVDVIAWLMGASLAPAPEEEES